MLTHESRPEADAAVRPVARPAGPAGPSGMLGLQRQVGNAAVAARVQRQAVQRDGDDDDSDIVDPYAGQAGAGGSGAITGDGTGATTITGGSVGVDAASINLNAPMVTASGVLQAQTLIVDSVVSASYTPGVGNTQ